MTPWYSDDTLSTRYFVLLGVVFVASLFVPGLLLTNYNIPLGVAIMIGWLPVISVGGYGIVKLRSNR